MTAHYLVSGGGGYIGRALVGRLKEAGHQVTAPDRRQWDIARDPVPSGRFDRVFHLASRVGVKASWEEPGSYLENNLIGTIRILEACRRTGMPLTLVSGYAYGRPDRLPIDENCGLAPNNPYALSKAMAEEAATFYGRHLNVAVVALRVFNVYGPGQSRDYVIPEIMAQIMDPTVATVVVADLAPRRDYVHLDDVIEAIVATCAARSGIAVYNVGSGRSYSVADVIEVAMAATGVRKPYRDRGEVRRQEIDEVRADISAIERDLGWRPRIGLAEGLGSMVSRVAA
ncbi:MAG: NAD-dependent epimerase/dehydratase family protein [Alphaproteobacteria bacterium]|nr:NAD-dependent epimerase/dehydratase family protein [Alphaproteobacteria bacterium]